MAESTTVEPLHSLPPTAPIILHVELQPSPNPYIRYSKFVIQQLRSSNKRAILLATFYDFCSLVSYQRSYALSSLSLSHFVYYFFSIIILIISSDTYSFYCYNHFVLKSFFTVPSFDIRVSHWTPAIFIRLKLLWPFV